MATLRIDIEQSGGQSVQRQINNLRETTNQLNRTILQNREASLGADRAEQRHLRTLNQSNAVQKAQIQQRIQELNLQKQNIALAEREARAREGQARGAGILTRSLGALGTQVGALGFAVAAREVGQFVASSARAAIQVESYTNAFASLGLGAQGAAQRIDQLQELSRLPGISFDQAVAGAVRLRTVGIEGERADAVLREMGNALALVGSTDLSGALLGLTQIASRGRVSAEEINQLTERSGIFAAALQEAFGSISSENIQQQLDDAGESVQEFVDRFVGALQGQARVSLDSTANAIQNLQNSFFLLQAEIGQRLTPVIASSARGLGDFLDRVRDFISGADDGTEATASFRQALQEADTALERRDAIDARIDYLETFKQGLFDAANELDRFDSRLAGIQGQIDETNERIQTLTDIREGRITTADLERDLEGLIDTYSDLAAEETRREEQVQLTHLAVSEVARARLVQIRDEKDELADQIEEYQNYISVSREVGEAAEQAATRATEGNQSAADATENLNTQLVRIGDQVTRLSDAFNEVSGTDDIQAIEAAASNLTSALERELALQLMDAELTAADRLDLELSTARVIEGVNRDAQQRISQISQDRSDEEVAAAERQRDARIQSAERARAAEVAGFERAAESGASYAEQLAMIESVAQRRAFVAIVERLQEQGLSLREALEEAERYIPVLQQRIPDAIENASGSLRDFSITSQDAFQASADSVVNLTGNIIALGGEIREVIREAERLERLDFSDVNASLNEQRYFQQNPGRDVIGEDQRAAGQQGRAYILQNFPEQAAALGITPQTTAEAQRQAAGAAREAAEANQDYVASLNSVVGAIDELTPVIEGIFGVDISSPRSLGHLGLDTASGVGQVLSGDVIGGVSSLIRSFYEFGQPDAEALAQQHQQALERERQRIANIQAELDAYDMERENLFAARLDFLRSGESTFSDWTDTLQSFSDTDLVRGRQVFSEFSRAMNALNDEVNQGRLSLVPLASSAAFTTRQRITAGRPAFGADLDAPVDDQERGVVQTIGGVPVDTAPVDDVTQGISDLDISNLQGQADEAIETFREAITAPARTIESLNEAFATLEPQLRTLYDSIREQIIGPDGIISDAEQIELNRLGTFTEFISQWTGLRDRAIQGVMQAQQRLAVTSQQIATSNAISEFGELVNAPGETIESLTEAWETNVIPLLNALYDELFAQIAGPDGFINTTEETTAFLQLGSREDFVGDYENRIFNPAISSMRSVEQDIANLLQSQELEDTFDGFNAAILIPGQTIEGLTAYWDTNVVPTLRTVYDGLRADIIGEDGLISPTELRTLIQRGLNVPFEDWVGQYEDGVLTPGINRLQSAAQVIASITQSRAQDDLIKMFNAAIEAPGQTIEGLNTYWVDNVVPVLRTTYNQARAEVIGEDGIISPEEAAELTRRGLDIPFEDWVSPYEQNILTPGTQRLMGAAQVITNITQGRAQTDIIKMFNAAATAPGATIESVNMFWVDNVVPVLRTTYDGLRAEIIGEDGLISPEEAAELTRRGLDIPFEDWDDQFETGIRDPAIQSLQDATAVIEGVTQTNAQSDVIQMFNDAVKAPGATIEGITTFWTQNVIPVLRGTYDQQRAEIIGEDGLISPQELAELARRGLNVPFEDWASQFRTDIFEPGVAFIEGEAEYLESTELQTGVDGVIENWKAQLEAPGATLQGLTEAWNTNVVPALRNLYSDLYDDIAGADGIINTARERAELLQLGTEEEFIAGFGSDIFDPAIQSFESRQQGSARRRDRFNIRQARFNLGGATSEGEFDTLFGVLQTAVDTFYDNEEQRIRALGLSVEETTQLLAENDQNRREELRGLSNLTNTFAQDRIDSEMRVQMEIEGLRDREFENEERRQQRLTDLAEEHQQRLTDIERDGLQAREDLQREFSRDIADINQEAREQIAQLLQGEGIAAGDINRFLSGLEGNVRSRLSASGLERLREIETSRIGAGVDLNRQRERDAEDLRIRQERAIQDAQIAFTRSEEDINAQATATATAITEALTPLLEMQGGTELATMQASTAQLQSETAMTEATTAATAATTETTRADTAVTESANATMMSEFFTTFADIPEHLRGAGDRLFEAGDHIIDGISGSGLMDAASALQTVADNFHVLVTGNQAGVQQFAVAGSAPPVLPLEASMSNTPQQVIVVNADDLSTNVNVQPVITQRRP